MFICFPGRGKYFKNHRILGSNIGLRVGAMKATNLRGEKPKLLRSEDKKVRCPNKKTAVPFVRWAQGHVRSQTWQAQRHMEMLGSGDATPALGKVPRPLGISSSWRTADTLSTGESLSCLLRQSAACKRVHTLPWQKQKAKVQSGCAGPTWLPPASPQERPHPDPRLHPKAAHPGPHPTCALGTTVQTPRLLLLRAA